VRIAIGSGNGPQRRVRNRRPFSLAGRNLHRVGYGCRDRGDLAVACGGARNRRSFGSPGGEPQGRGGHCRGCTCLQARPIAGRQILRLLADRTGRRHPWAVGRRAIGNRRGAPRSTDGPRRYRTGPFRPRTCRTICRLSRISRHRCRPRLTRPGHKTRRAPRSPARNQRIGAGARTSLHPCSSSRAGQGGCSASGTRVGCRRLATDLDTCTALKPRQATRIRGPPRRRVDGREQHVARPVGPRNPCSKVPGAGGGHPGITHAHVAQSCRVRCGRVRAGHVRCRRVQPGPRWRQACRSAGRIGRSLPRPWHAHGRTRLCCRTIRSRNGPRPGGRPVLPDLCARRRDRRRGRRVGNEWTPSIDGWRSTDQRGNLGQAVLPSASAPRPVQQPPYRIFTGIAERPP